MPLPGPDTRVLELRVPGLAGTEGTSLLDATDTVNVAGDPVGEVVRPADRLHRPAPGPVLRALGGSVPRTLEGYLWSKMTSGGLAKASWALLFPFTLANVAYWMLPPVTRTSRLSRTLAAGCRALLRLAALLLTMLLVSQFAVLSLDLVAAQCLAPTSPCLDVAPSWLGRSVPLRTIIGLLPLAVLSTLLHWVSGSQWASSARLDASPRQAPTPGEGLREARNAPVLRRLHTAGTLAALAVLLAGGPVAVPASPEDRAIWVCALVLLGLTLLAALANPPTLGGEIGGWALVAVATATAIAAAVIGAPLRAPGAAGGLAGTDATVEGLAALLVAVCALFAALLVPTALLARRGWSGQPKRLRPWAGGWAAAPTLVLACLLGGGFGAGSAIALRELVGASALRLPESYTLITMLWGAALAVAALLAIAGFAVAVPLRRLRRGIPAIVRLLHPQGDHPQGDHRQGDHRQDSGVEAGDSGATEEPATQAVAAAAWARASWERHWLHRLVLAFVLAMSAGAIALLIGRYALHDIPGWLGPLSGIGIVTLGLLAFGLLRVIFSAARGTGGNRRLGAFADLVSFWPRMAHPAVPPCYALKVIPELTARARHHLSEPDTRVVLAGYHMGGLLATIAAGRLAASVSAAERERIGLVTAGSPLQWGYQRAFPAMFPLDSLAELYSTLDGRWRGLCRGTDSFGGGATSWRHQVADGKLLGVGFLPTGRSGALPAGRAGPTGALVIGGDHWLPDPMHGPRVGHRWAPGVQRNADYVADPEWDRAVSMAAGLQRPDTLDSPLAEQASLCSDLPGQHGLPSPFSVPSAPATTNPEQDKSGSPG